MFAKNEQEFSQIVEDNLDAVLSGRSSIDQVLQQYPQHDPGLRRELESAVWLHSRREQIQSRPGFTAASRKRIVERVREESRGREGKRAGMGFAWLRQRFVYRLAAALLIVVVLLSSGGGIVAFAQDALPGQQLYAVKRLSETVSYNLAASDSRKVRLDIKFMDRRFEEMEALLASGDSLSAQVTLAEYNAEVKQAASMLQQVEDTSLVEKENLAQQLNKGLLKKADRLAALAISAPQDLRAGFAEARDLTLIEAAKALGEQGEKNGDPPTPTPKTTETATPTATLAATSTVKPSKTPRPKQENSATEDAEALESNEKEKKPTITPRPTNPNRPTAHPTKEPKATKEEKPTKSNKKNP